MLDNYVQLTKHLLADIASSLNIDLSRDAQEIEHRVRCEGVRFLTVALPRLGKEFDSWLGRGLLPKFAGFKTDDDGIPRFLGGLIRLVYPTVTSVLALKHIRQLLYLWYKLELPYDKAIEAKCLENFIATDQALPDEMARPDPVLDEAAKLIAAVTCSFELERVRPKHGPGAVAEGLNHADKMAFKVIHPQVEKVFPFFEWFVPSVASIAYYDRSVLVTEDPVARIVLVPKDSRGPRIISCEPVGIQYLQQGISTELISCIHRSRLTLGRVNFECQEINQRYARYGSLGAGWVTLDMKDASDRVSLALVRRLFGGSHILEYLEATRSPQTRLPDGTLVTMKKFAPMGSALCFPVESLCFFALAVGVLVHHMGYSRAKALERLKVYGDDMIVASEDYEAILQYFPYVGLMFNEAKCCTSGLFRESCGLDAYNGVSVTPIRIRTLMTSCLRKDASSLSSWCAYQRAFFDSGYWQAAEYIRATVLESVVLPTLSASNADLAFLYFVAPESDIQHVLRRRVNPDLQRLEVLADVVQGKAIIANIPGYERLHWNTSGVSFEGLKQPRIPVRRRVSRRRRWCGIMPHDLL